MFTPESRVRVTHVAIGNVAISCASTASTFALVHAVQQTGGYRHQQSYFAGAGSNAFSSPTFVDRHFRHRQTGIFRQARHGIHQPAFCGVCGESITCAPVDHLAMVFDINNEINAPPKPMMAEKISNMPRFRPLAVRVFVYAQQAGEIPSTTMMATLVAIKQKYAFHLIPLMTTISRFGPLHRFAALLGHNETVGGGRG